MLVDYSDSEDEDNMVCKLADFGSCRPLAARADVDEFVTRFKRRLEDEVRQQGAQRDVCDAETLEGIFRQTLLACAVD